MKFYLVLFILLSFCFISCNSQKNIIKKESNFDTILKTHELTFNSPQDFKEIPVKDNLEIKYQYALKHDLLDFEIRFLVKDINTAIKLPKDKRSLSLLTSITINVSGNILPNIPKIQNLGQETANQEYNADWIVTSTFISKSKFTTGYNYCSIIALRKDQNCEMYIFFLFNDKNLGANLISNLANTTCLKFTN